MAHRKGPARGVESIPIFLMRRKDYLAGGGGLDTFNMQHIKAIVEMKRQHKK